jgi:hypothetical protein
MGGAALLAGSAGVAGASTLSPDGLSNAGNVSDVVPGFDQVTNAADQTAGSTSVQPNGTDYVPSLNLDAERFNRGGAAAGYGAASLVSSAYLGAGTSAFDAGKYVAEPDSIHFVNHGSYYGRHAAQD